MHHFDLIIEPLYRKNVGLSEQKPKMEGLLVVVVVKA